ncbi:hypothetical protein COU79_02720 [Candidatus Peregrinibacteria bacterium CG10_big_fil_rev_8_21_14_0_10_54_7]|nr:MAG: hypothetical protein COU79_02720 [Candidatus Peregrinibacteria bacterium CG10_big_fil_rev_8_21_14_0_10_54_7]
MWRTANLLLYMNTLTRSIPALLPAKTFAAALALVAIVFLPLDAVGFTLPKIFCISLGGFLGALAALRDSERDILSMLLTTWTGRFFLALAAITVLSPLWSIAPILSIVGSPPRFQGVITQVAYFSIAIGGLVSVQREGSRSALVRSIITANAIVVLYGALQAAGLDPFAGVWRGELFLGRVFSTIGQPTMLGNFLLLTLPFVAWQMRESTGDRRYAGGVLTFLNLAILLATASRAAVLGLLIAAVLWMLTMPWPADIRPDRRVFVACVLIIVSLAGIATWSFSNRFSSATQQFLSFGVRGVLWESAASMAKEWPSGYGLGTVGLVSPRFLSPGLYEGESLTVKIDDVHSEPLQILVSLGLPGILLTFGFLALLLAGLWRNRTGHPLLPVLLVALAGTHASLLFGVADPATGAFLWLLSGMALGSLPSPACPAPGGSLGTVALGRHPSFTRCLLSAAVAGSFITAIVSGWWLVARVHRERSEAILRGGATLAAANASIRTAVIFPYDRQILIETAETALLALERTEDPVVADHLHRAVHETMEQLSALTSGQDGMVPLLLGWQAAIRGDVGSADRFFTEARVMRPIDVTVYRIAAHGYLLLGDRVRERETLQALAALLPPAWNDPSSPRGRILRKENPWLEPLFQ